MLRLSRRQPGLPEFIHIPPRTHPAVVRGIGQFFCGQVNDKFPGLPDDIIGIPLRADRNGHHSRVGTDCSDPCHGNNIRFFALTPAADHHCRQRVEHIACSPVLFLHIHHTPRGSSLPASPEFTSSLPSAESCLPEQESAASFSIPGPSVHRYHCHRAAGRLPLPVYPRLLRSRAAPWTPG